MVRNYKEKKTIVKTFKVSENKLEKIEKYMKDNSINMFSKFIDSLIDRELNKEKTLFSV